jgi:hypothetical protein
LLGFATVEFQGLGLVIADCPAQITQGRIWCGLPRLDQGKQQRSRTRPALEIRQLPPPPTLKGVQPMPTRRRARDLLGVKRPKRTRAAPPPAPKSPRQRLIGKVSSSPRSPRRVLPRGIGDAPDPALITLFFAAADLLECGRRLKHARPELSEAERLALMRKHFDAINRRWSAAAGRKELARLARRHMAGLADFEEEVEDGDNDDDDNPNTAA